MNLRHASCEQPIHHRLTLVGLAPCVMFPLSLGAWAILLVVLGLRTPPPSWGVLVPLVFGGSVVLLASATVPSGPGLGHRVALSLSLRVTGRRPDRFGTPLPFALHTLRPRQHAP